MLWMEGSPSGIPAILLAFSQPHQRMLGSIIIYNLEQYQPNGVRPFDASKQLSYWEQAHGQKSPNLKFLEGKSSILGGSQGCAQGIFPWYPST